MGLDGRQRQGDLHGAGFPRRRQHGMADGRQPNRRQQQGLFASLFYVFFFILLFKLEDYG